MALIYTLTPVGAEFTENLLHLAATGHTAHAIPDAEHSPDSPEHGCSGLFHTCICHGNLSFVVDPAPGEPVSQPAHAARLSEPLGGPTDGHLQQVFRPPRID